jgi:hypothetical protein
MTMLLCLAIAACGSTSTEPTEDGQSEKSEKSEEAMKWKDPGGPWTDCRVRDQICKCRGDVEDCRNPRPAR